MFGDWIWPVVASLGLIVVLAALELTGIAIINAEAARQAANQPVKSAPERPRQAA